MSEDRANTANLLKAIEFASRKHSTQRRKDKEASPYINHPIAVAHLLADTGCVTDLVTLIAAVLHDTIEDTKTTAEELEAQFGPTVRKVVEELTDDKVLDKALRKQSKWTTRRTSLLRRRPSNWPTQDRQRAAEPIMWPLRRFDRTRRCAGRGATWRNCRMQTDCRPCRWPRSGAEALARANNQ
jgi:guanosine-3',5'-bis(diphosphate) 3'-pyrophosphohydrolase